MSILSDPTQILWGPQLTGKRIQWQLCQAYTLLLGTWFQQLSVNRPCCSRRTKLRCGSWFLTGSYGWAQLNSSNDKTNFWDWATPLDRYGTSVTGLRNELDQCFSCKPGFRKKFQPSLYLQGTSFQWTRALLREKVEGHKTFHRIGETKTWAFLNNVRNKKTGHVL